MALNSELSISHDTARLSITPSRRFDPLSPLFEIALVLMRLDQITSCIVNANHGIVSAAAVYRVADLHYRACHTTADRMEEHRKSDQRRVYL